MEFLKGALAMIAVIIGGLVYAFVTLVFYGFLICASLFCFALVFRACFGEG